MTGVVAVAEVLVISNHVKSLVTNVVMKATSHVTVHKIKPTPIKVNMNSEFNLTYHNNLLSINKQSINK